MPEIQTEVSKKGKTAKEKKSPLAMIIIALLVINTGVVSYLFLNQSSKKTESAEASEEESAKPLYYKFNPAFIINIPSRNGMKFLQVEVQVMARKQSAINAVEEYAPVIKNDLIVLFSSQDYDELMTPAGKENLRKATLNVIQKAIGHSSNAGVEEVLFTNFITQ